MKPDFIKVLGLKPDKSGLLGQTVCVSDLQKALEEKCKVVEGRVTYLASPDVPETLHEVFEFVDKEHCTHRAFMFGVERIVKEVCKHEPIGMYGNHTGDKVFLYDCKHCGVKLKPVAWQVEG